MRCAVAISEQPSSLAAALAVAQTVLHDLGPSGCDLAFLFLSPHFVEDMHEILETVHDQLRPKVLLGAMGDGVIGGDQELEGKPALVLWGLSQSGMVVTPFRLVPNFEGELPVLEGWPSELTNADKPFTCVIVADPFTTPVEGLFDKLEGNRSKVQIIGGLASGGMDQGDNRLVLNQSVFDSGVVGVAVQGNINVRMVVSQGCRPIGERFVVTKAERNILHELGGANPIDRLETMIRDLPEHTRRQVLQGIQVGIAMDEYRSDFSQGDFLIRGLLGANRQNGSLVVGDFLHEGQTIQFHVRDQDAASEDLRTLLARHCQTFPESHPQGALLFSCNGRGQRFFALPHHDISAIRDQVGSIPIAGFFAGGEFGPVGGKNYLHGYTASLALFHEVSD